MSIEKNISRDTINEFSNRYNDSHFNEIIANSIISNGIQKTSINRKSINEMQYTFSEEIETGKITAQKQSGRCWIFAALNTLRFNFAKKHNLKDFELSQSYLFFWDKFEKSNYFLESIIETLDENTYSRVLMWLLKSPIEDGGQWDMFLNLVNKYGVVPKSVMPESFHSSTSAYMNVLITVKLREFACTLRKEYSKGTSTDKLREMKKDMMSEVYKMLSMMLGEPPKTFNFEYREDENKTFHKEENISALDFYKKYIDLDVNDFVSIINAPTQDKPYNNTYTVQYLGNVIEGNKVKYLNLTTDELKALAMSQLKDGVPVWFGCDVGKMMDRESGIMDTDIFKFGKVLNTNFNMTKAERLDYGESFLTHAMVFTGVDIRNDKSYKWKVENSWGEEHGNKGFFIMSDKWFDEHMYQIVINKKYLSDAQKKLLEKEMIVLPPWDPMGSLAK